MQITYIIAYTFQLMCNSLPQEVQINFIVYKTYQPFAAFSNDYVNIENIVQYAFIVLKGEAVPT